MRQPVYGFDWTRDDRTDGFGFASGRTVKEARSRLRRRYKLSAQEVETVTCRNGKKS